MLPRRGSSFFSRLGAAALEELGELVASNPVEPAAESASAGVILPASGGSSQGQEDFVRQVRRIGILETTLPGEAIHEAAVQLHELLLGGAIARIAPLDKQAGSGKQRIGHPENLAPIRVLLQRPRRIALTTAPE